MKSKKEPKQETLKEFTKQVLEDEIFTNISEYNKAERFIEIGAKWQQDNSDKKYTEEDMYWAINMSIGFRDGGKTYSDIDNEFQKFKQTRLI